MKTLRRIFNGLTFNQRGDNHGVSNFGHTIGVVMDVDDPLQMGRLRIFCPDLNDDPKKPQHLPWAIYVSPFGGSIRNSEHAKGHDPSTPHKSEGVTQYGFWAIPELGANVLVSTVNGDSRKRVWLGCLYENQEVGGLFNGVYDWEAGEDGGPDGPFSAPEPDFPSDDTKNKIQPLYNNQAEAFVDKTSPEWKTRGADYSLAVNVDIDKKGTHEELADNEKFEWVKDKLGASGYDWTSFKKLGSYLSSKMIGFVSPGLHSISFDDRPFNSRIKLRTTAGHQIILDDTNERIYVSTFKGKSWVELDTAGNIDIFTERNISMRAKEDINFSTDGTFRVKAEKGIYMSAGKSAGAPLEGDGVPSDGQIRFFSEQDTHFYTEGDMFQYVKGDMDFTLDGDFTGIVGKAYNLEIVTDEYNIKTPSSKIMINGSKLELESTKILLDGASSVQIQGGATRAKFSGIKVKIDATTVGFNDYGTTIGKIVSRINTCCTPLIPTPQIVIPKSPHNPEIDVKPTHISPWTNRVPDHEPWPRVMKIDGDDTQNKPSDGIKDNTAWIDQFTDDGDEDNSGQIGIVEGEYETPRGVFWRR